MAYVTVDQLKDTILGGGNDPAGTAATLAREVLADRLTTAQQQVDGRLAGAGYTVPFDLPAPGIVVDIVTGIAAYLADLTYRKGKPHSGELDPVIQRYRWALAQLNSIAGDEKGRRTAVIPGVPSPEAEVDEGAGAVAVVAIQPGGRGSGFMYPGTMPPRGGYVDEGWW